MCTSFLTLLLFSVAGFTWAAREPVDNDKKPTIDFTQQIAPLFQKHCYQCHGPEKQKNGLRLDQREAALKGGDLGQAIVPGQSNKSPLYRYVAGLEPDSIMPPKGPRLTREEVALLQNWIDEGAKWPESTSS
jgi:mono/diheme cytochrome c family protein